MIEPPPEEPYGLRAWIRKVLRSLGKRPSQRLSQVFLADPRGVRLLVENSVSLLEAPLADLGTGPGHLAYYVARHGKPVVGVEIDPSLARVASGITTGLPAGIILGDAARLVESLGVRGVFSNTPYKATSRIISGAARNNYIQGMVLGVQLEVAERILARPGSREYGRLTLLVRRYFAVREIGRLPKSWFYPEPEVHGGLIHFERIREWSPGDECFERLTACLFTGRNRLADKMAAKCTGLDRGSLSRLRGKRVRDLVVDDVEWLVAVGGCSRLRLAP
ncbi:MAG: hypothetical protein F7C33_01865 [Desulfurococcales archaeon]|nr:hypothetical protein [Desulfurococcales archaeon]